MWAQEGGFKDNKGGVGGAIPDLYPEAGLKTQILIAQTFKFEANPVVLSSEGRQPQ